MPKSVCVSSVEGRTGKSTVALGLINLLTHQVSRVGVYRPLYSQDGPDTVLDLILAQPGITQTAAEAVGVSYTAMHADRAAAMSEIVSRHQQLAAQFDALVVLGSDYTDVATAGEPAVNAHIAANIGAPVVLVVSGMGRTAAQIVAAAVLAEDAFTAEHAQVVAVLANRVDPGQVADARAGLAGRFVGPTAAVAEVSVLAAPTLQALIDAGNARVLRGNPAWLQRESLGLVVAAMSLPNVLTRLHERYTVIAPGDRPDLLPGLVLAHESSTFPSLAGVVLTGGYPPPESVQRLIDGVQTDLPIAVSEHDTFVTAQELAAVPGRVTAGSAVKIQTALRVFAESVDTAPLLAALDVATSDVVTPLMFTYRLIAAAHADRRHIVLPEGDDDRILRAAATLLRLGVADLTLLGNPDLVRAQASEIGVDISAAHIQSPKDPALVARFAAEYARLRADKGMTVDRAAEIVTDVSYFGTMMVHAGLADGMVSGAAHTTAHTISPAFKIIRTVSGTSIVSSVFFMCLADRVLVYGDCAVNPDPTAEMLADIAASSAQTARHFGIEPRVAMLSYSTGNSGHGADVDKVRRATQLLRAAHPELLVDGPIQYDAAVDPAVAAAKLPGSPVAGRATVLIFPDLNTGNNTYKAVQRSAGAVAIGPVLQGLKKPVNDLSRGALVDDIVNTVAITAIQAQARGGLA